MPRLLQDPASNVVMAIVFCALRLCRSRIGVSGFRFGFRVDEDFLAAAAWHVEAREAVYGSMSRSLSGALFRRPFSW